MLSQNDRDDLIVLRNEIVTDWGIEPDWSLLDDRRPELPEFPDGIFTEELSAFLTSAAHGSGTTVAHVATPLLSIASGLIGASRCVQPSRTWSEPLSLWAAIVGESGSGKTPAIGVTKTALDLIDRNRRDHFDEMKRRHETKAEEAKAARKIWEKAVAEAKATPGSVVPQKPAEAADVPPFVKPRLYTANATIEQLARLIEARPAGLAMVVDELSGLFANMGRYSNGTDRQFWLEAWNGRSYQIDRVGGPPVNIDRLLISLLGGFQPDKLKTAFPEGEDDGFSSRFLYCWPQEPPLRPLVNDADQIDSRLVNALTRLIRLSEPDDGFASKAIGLSSDAAQAFEDFRKQHYAEKAGLDGRLREWFAKGPSQVLRLAGAIALLEWAWSGERNELADIGEPSMIAATTLWHEFFWPHSRACLTTQTPSGSRALAKRLLKFCKATDKREISREDARRNAFSGQKNADETQEIIDLLVRKGWLKKTQTMKAAHRPAHRYQVFPGLFE